MANTNIFSGVWIDHSRNPVLGATITLNADWGQNLISAAAIVVQIIGIALWTIVAYTIHQKRATAGLRDEFEAQLQVVLRNCVSADGAAWDLFSLGRAWDGRRPGVWSVAGWMSASATMIYAAFIVAGIFVGQIATNSYDAINVLLAPQACGFINLNAGASGRAGYSNVNINVSTNAQQYARSCYGGGSIISPISCSVYPVSSLNYNAEMTDQACPVLGGAACFEDDPDASPLRLRTEVVDSHRDLGINAPQGDRLSVQYEATCAPLDFDFVDDFMTSTTSTFKDVFFYPSEQNGTLEVYDFGPWTQFDFNTSYTFTYSPVVRSWGVGALAYSVNSFNSLAPHINGLSYWSPIAPFNQTSGDLSLITVAPNGVTFTEPVADPMFRTFDDPDPTLKGGAQYVPMRNVYFLACSEKWQICNVRNDRCTGWSTTLDLLNTRHWEDTLGLNPVQNATFVRLASAMGVANLHAAVFGVPDPLLASYNLISQTGSQALPNGHWRREVEGWFQSVLAKWQFLPSVFANIPLNILQENNVQFVPASEIGPEMEKQCHQQRVTAPQQYQSYNVFALVLIAVMGVLVPGIALALKSSHRFGVGRAQGHAYLSYQAEGLLQLHRMALEGAGYKGWEEGVKERPRTEEARKRIPQVTLEKERKSCRCFALILQYFDLSEAIGVLKVLPA